MGISTGFISFHTSNSACSSLPYFGPAESSTPEYLMLFLDFSLLMAVLSALTLGLELASTLVLSFISALKFNLKLR